MRSVSIFPGIPMGRFGENIFAEPIYRLVFSDSRTDLLGGKWPDGNCDYREVPRYPALKGQWIMEKWLSAEEYAGTREEYELTQFDAESGLYTCGPYPHRGEYTYCHTFIGNPTEMQVGWAVHNNKVSRDLTPGARKRGIRMRDSRTFGTTLWVRGNLQMRLYPLAPIMADKDSSAAAIFR